MMRMEGDKAVGGIRVAVSLTRCLLQRVWWWAHQLQGEFFEEAGFVY